MNLRLEKKASERIATQVAKALANSYILQAKLQNFHWNIEDGRFASLHAFFEEQYRDLQQGVDELAERIRMLGERAPGSLREFIDIGDLEESTGSFSGDEMLAELLSSHAEVAAHLRSAIEEAQSLGDEGTADLFIARLRTHEKFAWMIRSHIR